MSEPGRVWPFVVLGVAGLALAATLVGFFATWDAWNVDAGGFGPVTIRWHLNDFTQTAGSRSQTQTYATSDTDPHVKLAFEVLARFVWGSVAVLAVTLVLLVLSTLGLGPPLLRRLVPVGLAAFVVVSALGVGLFAYNFPHAVGYQEGSGSSSPSPSDSFWGKNEGMTWGPGFAWYAGAAAPVLGLVALGGTFLTRR